MYNKMHTHILPYSLSKNFNMDFVITRNDSLQVRVGTLLGNGASLWCRNAIPSCLPGMTAPFTCKIILHDLRYCTSQRIMHTCSSLSLWPHQFLENSQLTPSFSHSLWFKFSPFSSPDLSPRGPYYEKKKLHWPINTEGLQWYPEKSNVWCQ